MPMARPCWCAGNARTMIDRVPGVIIAAPIPWMMRKRIKVVMFGARPQARDALLKIARPARYISRCPHRSPRRPIPIGKIPIIRTYPEIVHEVVPSGARKLWPMAESATFTIKRSIYSMSRPKQAARSVSHLEGVRLSMKNPPGELRVRRFLAVVYPAKSYLSMNLEGNYFAKFLLEYCYRT